MLRSSLTIKQRHFFQPLPQRLFRRLQERILVEESGVTATTHPRDLWHAALRTHYSAQRFTKSLDRFPMLEGCSNRYWRF